MQGKKIEGILEASGRENALTMLRQKLFYPVQIKQIKEHKNIREWNIFSNISSKDLSIFCKQYASILKAGIPPVQGFYILINQTDNPFLKEAMQKVYLLVQGGHSLSHAMMNQGNTFPLTLIRTVESGELSGTLETSFERMADHFEREYTIRQKIRRALAYPLVLLITSILIIFFLMRIVVPQFITLFDNNQTQLPKCTRILLGTNNFLSNYSIWILISIVIIYLGSKIIFSYNRPKIFIHGTILKIPYIGKLINKIISARFNRTMAILISAGVPIIQALTISSKVTKNESINRGLTKAISMVQQGEGLAKSFGTLKILSPEIINIIAVGEESGQIEEMMDKIADICEIEVEGAIDRFVTLLEPISILILGGIIAFIVISVTLPMFEIYVFLD